MSNKSPKKANREDWHPARIKMELELRGINLSAIAKAHGLACTGSLSQAMVRSLPSGERRIASALGLHPKEIWPSRYFDNGERKPQGIRAVQCTAVEKVRNSKFQAAA